MTLFNILDGNKYLQTSCVFMDAFVSLLSKFGVGKHRADI